MNEDGDVWVPRTVPYLKAREVARVALSSYDARLKYVGKTDTYLLGFTRDCPCEEVCERRWSGEEDRTDEDTACRVPAWHFREVES